LLSGFMLQNLYTNQRLWIEMLAGLLFW